MRNRPFREGKRHRVFLQHHARPGIVDVKEFDLEMRFGIVRDGLTRQEMAKMRVEDVRITAPYSFLLQANQQLILCAGLNIRLHKFCHLADNFSIFAVAAAHRHHEACVLDACLAQKLWVRAVANQDNRAQFPHRLIELVVRLYFNNHHLLPL